MSRTVHHLTLSKEIPNYKKESMANKTMPKIKILNNLSFVEASYPRGRFFPKLQTFKTSKFLGVEKFI